MRRMDQSTVLFAGATLLAAAFISFYTVVVLWTPPPIITRPSEHQYMSNVSPTKPLPLGSLADAGSIDLSVVIPAYNEAERMPIMVASTIKHLSSLSPPRSYELLIVDDGSKDATVETAMSLAAKYPESEIRVVKLEKNLGKGGAVRHGMLFGRGKRLLMVDADDASQFEDLELLWKAMDELVPESEAAGLAVAVGSRAHMVGTAAVVKRSFLRNVLMHGFHTILQIFGVGHIRDTQCGFKLFSRAAAQQIFPAQHLTTWIFDVELLLLAKQMGIPVAEVPIRWHEVAGSKLNVALDSLQMLRDLLVLRGNQLLGRWKAGR